MIELVYTPRMDLVFSFWESYPEDYYSVVMWKELFAYYFNIFWLKKYVRH